MTLEEKIDYICTHVSFDKEDLLVNKDSLEEDIEDVYESILQLKGTK